MTPTHSHASSFSIRRVGPEAVRPLRAAILRPGRPLGESIYPLDEHSEAAHFGAIEGISGEIVGSTSVFHQPADALDPHVPNSSGECDAWRSVNAWRLRGMTVIERMRGRDCGAMLLAAAIEHVTHRGGTCLWFHARASARGFYQRFDFIATGPTYDSPPIGEHVFMWRAFANAPRMRNARMRDD